MANLQQIKKTQGQVAKHTPQATLQAFLEKGKAQLAAALPKHITPERMMRLAVTAFNNNKQLQNCRIETVASSLMLASQLGLEPGVNGQGYLVPYKGVCTFVPGWKGLVDLFNRSGSGTVWTGAVFEGDEFDWALGDRPFVQHRPIGEDDPSRLTYVYAVGRINGSEWPVIDVWPVLKCQRHRDRNNKVGAKHYSYNRWEMYCRKLPLLQILKYLPCSIELSKAVAAEGAAEEGHIFDLNTEDFVQVDADQPVDNEVNSEPPPADNATDSPEKAEQAETPIKSQTEVGDWE